MKKKTYENLFRIDAPKLYDWFFLKEKVPNYCLSMKTVFFEFLDDDFEVSLDDLKVALNAMKEDDRTFEEIYNWSIFFFYQMFDKLTRKQRYRRIHKKFKFWEVGFEDDEIDYIVYCLCREVETMCDEDIFDASLLKAYIDDLLLDISFFEKEEEQGNVMRHNLCEIRKEDIIVYFATSDWDTKELNEEEIFLYKKMMLILVACQEGIYGGFLQNRLDGFRIVNQKGQRSDERLQYKINCEWQDEL